MGQVTPNISIYIPSAGETNYDTSFAAGMVNIDQHDHSGGPNKGVPISGTGIAAGAITYDKLNANVADNTTGIGTAGAAGANQLSMLGILKNIYQLATATGFIAKNGAAVTARTITGTAGQIAVTNGAGVAGDPTIAFSPITTNTTQPAFFAAGALQADVTGDGTPYTVVFNAADARNFNQGGYFDGTSTFTVPALGTGIYLIDVDLSLGDLGAAHTTGFVDIFVNGVQAFRGFNCNVGAIANAAFGAELPFSQICKLTAGDTVTIVVTVSGGALVVDVLAGSSSFSAVKIC